VEALSVVLSDYPARIIDYAADPRTGISAAFPNGLPNVGQIKRFLDDKLSHFDRLQRLAALPKTERSHAARPRPMPQPGDLANVFVPKDKPLYARFVERAQAEDTNPREFRFQHGREGIFVALTWFDSSMSPRQADKLPTLSDDALRLLYPKQAKQDGDDGGPAP
jgi:hypothetical protein